MRFWLEERRTLQWKDAGWQCLSPQCEQLKVRLRAILEDWGACLEVRLYEEALIHFCGGQTQCLRRVPIVLEGVELGTQVVQLHAEGLCFLATAFTTALEAQRLHIGRLLALTGLRAIQWINFNRNSLQLTTIQAV